MRFFLHVVITLSAIALVSTSALAAGESQPATRRPSIVVFIADDLSWHDLGCYGASDVHTPNVDKLAAQSLRFSASGE